MTWPLNGREAGGDLVLIQALLLLLCKSSCSYASLLVKTRNPIEDGAISGFSGQKSVPEQF